MKTQSKIYVGGMLCHCCQRLVTLIFEKENIETARIDQAMVELKNPADYEKATNLLKTNGFYEIIDRERVLVEQIKMAIIELVHYANNSNSIIRNSDYLVEKLDIPYQQLSSLFTKFENQTLEKYIIKHKIEKTKEMLDDGNLTLSEIAFQMGYSSVHYLSNQFKKSTGVTVSEYKQSGFPKRIPFDEI